jgi:hypothetical protein
MALFPIRIESPVEHMDPLPKIADIVIIGGAMIAWFAKPV